MSYIRMCSLTLICCAVPFALSSAQQPTPAPGIEQSNGDVSDAEAKFEKRLRAYDLSEFGRKVLADMKDEVELANWNYLEELKAIGKIIESIQFMDVSGSTDPIELWRGEQYNFAVIALKSHWKRMTSGIGTQIGNLDAIERYLDSGLGLQGSREFEKELSVTALRIARFILIIEAQRHEVAAAPITDLMVVAYGYKKLQIKILEATKR